MNSKKVVKNKCPTITQYWLYMRYAKVVTHEQSKSENKRERERDVTRFSVVIPAHAMWKFDNRRINNFCMGRLE